MWNPFDEGKSIGRRGSEEGIIIRDEEHGDGSRITIERDGNIAPFSITCGIYGWMVHTRFFSSEKEATQEYETMKVSLNEILNMIPLEDEPEVEEKMDAVNKVLSNFVEQYP
jgi:hypothetical protein